MWLKWALMMEHLAGLPVMEDHHRRNARQFGINQSIDLLGVGLSHRVSAMALSGRFRMGQAPWRARRRPGTP